MYLRNSIGERKTENSNAFPNGNNIQDCAGPQQQLGILSGFLMWAAGDQELRPSSTVSHLTDSYIPVEQLGLQYSEIMLMLQVVVLTYCATTLASCLFVLVFINFFRETWITPIGCFTFQIHTTAGDGQVEPGRQEPSFFSHHCCLLGCSLAENRNLGAKQNLNPCTAMYYAGILFFKHQAKPPPSWIDIFKFILMNYILRDRHGFILRFFFNFTSIFLKAAHLNLMCGKN